MHEIVFVRYSDTTWLHTDSGYELYLINADGSDERRLTTNDAHDAYPAWSRDGRRLAFVSDRDNAGLRGRRMNAGGGVQGAMMGMDVSVMSADGSQVKRLTQDTTSDFVSPQGWSPDGQHLLIDSERDGAMEIYVLSVDGAVTRKVTDNTAWDGNSNWSPDGRQIAFRSNRTGEHTLYVMAAEGGDARAITPLGERPNFPAWSPGWHTDRLLVPAQRKLRNHDGERQWNRAAGSDL
jgi:TolB protein